MGSKHFHSQVLSLGGQAALMRERFPSFRCHMKANKVIWTGDLRPSQLSSVYRVKIDYKLRISPKVFVVSPKLQEWQGEKIPHIYPDYALCLYRPSKGEWNCNMFIAETIVPWVSLWLFYYEVWQATGKWFGEGEHPDSECLKKT
jgi:hypothetical protein